jgi:hypothetical protein
MKLPDEQTNWGPNAKAVMACSFNNGSPLGRPADIHEIFCLSLIARQLGWRITLFIPHSAGCLYAFT